MKHTAIDTTRTGIPFGTTDNSTAANDAVSETKAERVEQYCSLSLSKADSVETETDTASEITASVVGVTGGAHQECCDKDLDNNEDEDENENGPGPSIGKNVQDKRDDHDAESPNDYENEKNSASQVGKGDSNPKKQRQRVTFSEPEVDAQEWTYDDHYRSTIDFSRRKEEKKLKYERAERRRISKLMWCAVALLLLEVAGATIAVMNHQELVECCGNSIFSENESRAEQWDKTFYWIGIAYLIVIILIEIPTLVIAQETMFLFNPMVGYLLAMQMMYATDTRNAYIIYGLESAAMLGQSIILMQMQRSPEMCIHSILNYTLSGITVYLLLRLTQQGGYCIVDDRIQSVFTESTCNMDCIDEASCFRCTGGGDDDLSFSTQCFIRFGES
eukprot:jgi/Psemu1/27894/gm1.27894_g